MTPKRTVVRGGHVVLPGDQGVQPLDLLIENGLIARVERNIPPPGDAEEIDATGLTVLPGVIDSHVHFREPGLTHKENLETGSRAAARSGVTSFLDMPNTNPPTVDQSTLDAKLARAKTTSYVNFGFFIGATLDNLSELQSISGAAGIKIFAGSSTGNLLVDDQRVLERIFRETSLRIAAHCEDESTVRANLKRLAGDPRALVHSQVRTPEAAARSVARLSALAVEFRHPLHVLHVSTRLELDALPQDAIVTAEACIPHLFLDTGAYEKLGHFAKVNPALRGPDDRAALWAALGARVATVATDHAPHTPKEKDQPYPSGPSGIPSIEFSLPLMLDAVASGKLTLNDVVRLMSERPAEIWGIANKGRIQEGFDADLVLVDLSRQQALTDETVWTRAGWTPWSGQSLLGWPVRTIVGGRTVVLNDVLVGEPRGSALRFTLLGY